MRKWCTYGRYRFLWPIPGFLLLVVPLGAQSPVPWPSGEKLSYEIHWGLVKAADAEFHAVQDGELWDLSMKIQSRGLVDDLYPFWASFQSTIQPQPWRTLLFIQDRREGKTEQDDWKRLKQYRISFDYAARKGHFQDPNDGRDIRFDLGFPQMDDMLSMLYGVRTRDWDRAPRFRFLVADRYKEASEAEAVLLDRRHESLDDFPKQRFLVVQAQKLYDDPERQKQGIWTRVWVTDDARRLPLLARLKFKYGTFTIRLRDQTIVNAPSGLAQGREMSIRQD